MRGCWDLMHSKPAVRALIRRLHEIAGGGGTCGRHRKFLANRSGTKHLGNRRRKNKHMTKHVEFLEGTGHVESLHGFADLVKPGRLPYGAKNRRDGDLTNLPGRAGDRGRRPR
jgi:hypothetical protein